MIAKICTLLRPPKLRADARHSSPIGLGVTDPATPSCDRDASRLSKEKLGVDIAAGDGLPPPNRDGERETVSVLAEVRGGVDVAPPLCRS